MFALVGQVERALRGREAFQEIDLVATDRRPRQVGGRDRTRRPTSPRRSWPRPSARPSAGRPGPVLLSLPEDLLDELVPGDAGRGRPFRPTRVEPEPDDDPGRHRAPGLRPPAGHPRRRRRPPRARTSPTWSASPSCSRCRSSPRGAAPTSSPNDHPLYLGMTGLGAAADRPRAARRRRRHRSSSAAGSTRSTTFGYACPRAGMPLGARRPRAAGGARRPAAPRRSRSPPMPGRSCEARQRAAPRPAPSSTPSASRRRGRRTTRPTAPPARRPASSTTTPWDGPGRPSRAGSIATLRRVLPTTRS